ncbi:MAG TPA: hypothetical protein C5S37_01440 [Methanophagales archaeon]|nr:hypothetical protein [Methanophagales archaeon]
MTKRNSKGILVVALLVAAVLMVGLFGSTIQAYSAGEYSVGDYVVSEEKALEHATVYMLDAVLTQTPGLEEWRGAMVNPEPLTIYDMNGKKLFYEFSVEKKGKMVGTIKASASAELGPSVYTLEIGPRPWDASAAIEKAKELAQQEYDGEIISAKLVCYSYPKIGVIVTFADQPVTGEKRRMIIDAADYSIIPDKKPEAEGIGVWSLYESIPEEEKLQRIAEWESDDKFVSSVIEKANSMGIEDLTAKVLSEEELKSLEEQIVGDRAQMVLGVPLYGQTNSVRCCVASAQMIAKWYFVTHTQDYIAGVMGCGDGSLCWPDQELLYYKEPSGLHKAGSFTDYSPTFEEAKNEISQLRPFRSGIPGHCRVCRGWGTYPERLYINDPWPENEGRKYWENWGGVTHTNDIYVREANE